MVTQKFPLISKFTDEIENREYNFGLTAYAAGKIFTGVQIPDATDLNHFLKPGISRINDTVLNAPMCSDPTGFIEVLFINKDEDTSVLKNTIRVRQIVYPDNTNESMPYTRVGEGTSINDLTWNVWTPFGGLTRLKLLEDTTALPNMLYYSFGPFTLTLPDPNSYGLGTKVGLEQYMNIGLVKYNGIDGTEYIINTVPDISPDDVNIVIGALTYIFEVVSNNENIKEWRIHVGNNTDTEVYNLHTHIVKNYKELNTRLKTEVKDREKADTKLAADLAAEANTREKADIALDTRITVVDGRIDSEINNVKILISNEATTRSDADTAIRSDLGKETDARMAADTVLDNKLTTETSARIAADNALTVKLEAEATTRGDADATIHAKIDATRSRIIFNQTVPEVKDLVLNDAIILNNTPGFNYRFPKDNLIPNGAIIQIEIPAGTTFYFSQEVDGTEYTESVYSGLDKYTCIFEKVDGIWSVLSVEGPEPAIYTKYVQSGLRLMLDAMYWSGTNASKQEATQNYWYDLISTRAIPFIKAEEPVTSIATKTGNVISFKHTKISIKDGHSTIATLANGPVTIEFILPNIGTDLTPMQTTPITDMVRTLEAGPDDTNPAYNEIKIDDEDFTSLAKIKSYAALNYYCYKLENGKYSWGTSDATDNLTWHNGGNGGNTPRVITSYDLMVHHLANTAIDSKCSIHAIRVYNRILTDSELMANHRLDRERFGII